MAVNISYFAGAGTQFFDNNGYVLSGGKIYTYAAGTTTPQATYTSNSGITANANPIVLDSAGRPPNEIWLMQNTTYKFILKDANDTLIGTYDNIPGVNDVQTLIDAIYTDLASTSNNAKGDALVGFKQSNSSGFLTGAVGKTVNTKLQEVLTFKDFGATGDGVTDDTAAIIAGLTACPAYGSISFSGGGTYLVSSAITIPKDNITIDGCGAKILAKAATSYENVIYGSARTGVSIKNLYVDVNQSNRSSGQNVRFMGIVFNDSIECLIDGCTVTNTLGYASIPAVGIAFGGTSLRNRINNCMLLNCGTTAKPSDGVFCSGDSNLISDCIALACTDTGFVIESSNSSGITGCISRLCAAAAAITNAINTHCYGNYIDGLTAVNTTGGSGVTGQIQIGCPLSTSTGNLYDTLLSNVVLSNPDAGYGAGPAINIRKTGTPKAIGVTLNNVRINTTTAQGILIEADNVAIRGCDIKGVAATGIQFDGASANGFVSGCTIIGGTFGIATNSTASITAESNYMSGNGAYGIAALNTSTITAMFNVIKTPSVGYYGKDAGATLEIVGSVTNNLVVNNQSGAVITGAIVNKFPVFDKAGNPLGYVPLYNS